jgi:hypothetical protein
MEWREGYTVLVTRTAWKCEYPDCGHEWISGHAISPESKGDPRPPDKCAKCRRRKWHTVRPEDKLAISDEFKSVVRIPAPPVKLKSEAPSREVYESRRKCPKGDFCMLKKGMKYCNYCFKARDVK